MKYLRFVTFIFALACLLLSSREAAAEDLIHVVSRGETIYSISRFYSVAADDLMRANGISDPSRLQLGTRLVIPDQNTPATPVAGTQSLVNYRAVRGDTLFSIARTHGITLQRLREINGFAENHTLRAGDVVRVPGRANANTTASTPNSNTSTSTSTTTVRPATGLYALRWPITPRAITYMTGQMGVVVEGERQEPVRSLTQGNVVSAGPWRKFGRVVIVEAAGGYFYMYGGCETITVSVGDRITPGMELGRLGVNTVTDRPQLFFMVFRNDDPIDPATAPRAGLNTRS